MKLQDCLRFWSHSKKNQDWTIFSSGQSQLRPRTRASMISQGRQHRRLWHILKDSFYEDLCHIMGRAGSGKKIFLVGLHFFASPWFFGWCFFVDFDNSLKMPVCSRYGTDLFQKYFRPDGRTYNVCFRHFASENKVSFLIMIHVNLS